MTDLAWSLLWLALYACFTLVVAFVRELAAEAWLPSAVVLVMSGVLLGREWRRAKRRDYGDTLSGTAAWWALVPLLCMPLLYAQIGDLVASKPMHDVSILSLEHRWFGEPAREWARRYPSRTLSAVLHLGYLSYYFVIYLPPLRLALRRDDRALNETVLALTMAFVAGFVCFVLWPVEGPRYRWPALGNIDDNHVQRLTHAVLERYSSRGTAFPSSHVSVAVVQTLLAWRWQRRLAWALTPLAITLAIGAVYGGFHYLIDVVVGALLGTIIATSVLLRARVRRVPFVAGGRGSGSPTRGALG